MNYAQHYACLIDRARVRTLSCYSERHHIIPRCLGGDNSSQNVVRLTPEEHYVAHQLLVKMYPGNHRLVWALMNMTGSSKRMSGRKNKIYGWVRRKFAQEIGQKNLGRKASPELRAKLSAQRTGRKHRPHTEETKAKISAASKGKKKSPEHCAAMSLMRTGKKRGPNSVEWNKKISESNKRASLTRDLSYLQASEYKALQARKTSEVWARRKAGLLPPINRK